MILFIIIKYLLAYFWQFRYSERRKLNLFIVFKMIEQSSTSHKGDKSMLSTQLTKNRSAITSFYDC